MTRKLEDEIPPADQRIAVGVIRRPHGVRGEASVEIWSDDPDRFDDLERIFLVSPREEAPIRSEIVEWRPHKGRALVLFAGIETPEDVRRFQDWTVEIPLAEARSLDEGEYFLHDLQHLEVVRENGVKVGRVEQVSEGGGGHLLEVIRPDGRRFDLPLVSEFVVAVEIDEGRIITRHPEDLERLETLEGATSEKASSAEPKRRPRRSEPIQRIDVATIFPSMFAPFMQEGVIARAIEENVIEMTVHDLRDHASDRHRSTDDEAYGGGPGMVMLAEPVFRLHDSLVEENGSRPRVVLLSPQGRRFDQAVARELATEPWLLFLCGRYEGFDERIHEALVDEEISVGDFVVSGGEIPAMLVIDAEARLIEGVVGRRNSVEGDSFYYGLLDHPHYTRPAEVRGMEVPPVLLSGHAEQIRKWRKEQALRATRVKRPDLLAGADLDDEAREILARIESEASETE